ncbi:MAG: trypsin-like peptidase domain-containing protein [Anaerolineales bacterium]|nr:trypsin-like peptidase domain-containing protein [Anaerolineales bacterium]
MVNRRFFLSLAALTLLLATIACGLELVPPTRAEATLPPATQLPAVTSPAVNLSTPPLSNLGELTRGDLISLYTNVSPGVVTIWTFDDISAGLTTTLPTGQGSGFAIDDQGHIITNHHVIAGADEIEVDFPSGAKAWADLIGTDPDSDLAVLKVEIDGEFFTPLPLGDSDDVRVGEFVVAIGNPFGLRGTMTVGIISAIGRTLESERTTASGLRFSAGDLIQTDAAINPGNSGGPLLNMNGEVIGVNRAIQTESFTVEGDAANSGVGFAIPINIVRRVAPGIIQNGEYRYPYLGISSLDDDLWNLKTIQALGFNALSNGAYITAVVPGSPADQAGLQGGTSETEIPNMRRGGDLIVAIDKQPVYNFAGLLSYLFKYTEVGQDVTLTVLRDNEEVEIPLTIGARP